MAVVELKKTREEIIQKAWDLGIEYEAKYKGCCQSTFLAIVDALRWGGLEIIPKEMEEKLYSGIFFLTAGVCFSGEGTCGAVTGSVMAIGLTLAALAVIFYAVTIVKFGPSLLDRAL